MRHTKILYWEQIHYINQEHHITKVPLQLRSSAVALNIQIRVTNIMVKCQIWCQLAHQLSKLLKLQIMFWITRIIQLISKNPTWSKINNKFGPDKPSIARIYLMARPEILHKESMNKASKWKTITSTKWAMRSLKWLISPVLQRLARAKASANPPPTSRTQQQSEDKFHQLHTLQYQRAVK